MESAPPSLCDGLVIDPIRSRTVFLCFFFFLRMSGSDLGRLVEIWMGGDSSLLGNSLSLLKL